MSRPFYMSFPDSVLFGSITGLVCTATGIVVKNNTAAVIKGAFVGSLISGSVWIAKNLHDRKEFECMMCDKKIEELSSCLENCEKQTADVAATPN